ncbi:hypothetical protein [Prosthecobacter sp.]|uniref:hypothetical protein n=1 Tax=Prosthecobacter sp. TaxID=1965333 RepID=UPI002AB9DFAE|nr:hypothetical protein [Prosthecobacter sp.]MDZ4404356.1 hypothetical protein [Prosthecobacter sp.]
MKSDVTQHTALACRCFSIVCIAWSSAFGQMASLNHPLQSHVIRAVETKIEMVPNSKTIRVTITNHVKESRYLLMPLDLMSYRIKLTTSDGKELEMTSKGRKELVDPYPIGSMRLATLKTDVPWNESINLEPLFQFPEQGEVRCEVSRHILFTHPNDKPRDAEWISFPPIMLPSGNPAPKSVDQAKTILSPVRKTTEPLSTKSSFTKHDTPESTPAAASEKLTSSMRWRIIIVLIVAATGLLWLMLKKRK